MRKRTPRPQVLAAQISKLLGVNAHEQSIILRIKKRYHEKDRMDRTWKYGSADGKESCQGGV
jgi:hypothetical protein